MGIIVGEMEGTIEEGPGSGIKEQTWLRASKETGTPVLQPQGTKFCQQSE